MKTNKISEKDNGYSIKNGNEQLPSYTVDALLEKLGITANIKIWKSIDTIVYVQGVIKKIKAYERTVYFELEGGNSKISVKCPIEFMPQEGENVIIEGLPTIKPSRFNYGLDVIIDGKPVGIISPPSEGNVALKKLYKNKFIRLHDFIKNNSLDDFCILGTETAIRDVESQITSFDEEIYTKIIRVSEKKSLLKGLKNAVSESSGFAIVRGGDDASLSLWNDPEVIREILDIGLPFYVALGHTHFISLTTQYADESFHTPTDLGIMIDSIFRDLKNKSIMNQEISVLKKSRIEIDKELSVFKEKTKHLIKENDYYKKCLKITLFIAVVLGIILYLKS